MDARDDPTYLRLYQDYSKAIRRFEKAVNDRRQVRAQLAVKRSPVIRTLREWGRRPVGSPVDSRTSRVPVTPPTPPAAPRQRRIYMGKILGWAKVVYTSPVKETTYPLVDTDLGNLYDNVSLNLYWNAKNHYEDCKRAFFDYVRRQNIDLHREQAKQALDHGANLQLLGLDGDGESAFMQEARREVEAGCQNTWAVYQTSPSPKSAEVTGLLLEGIADAQFVDLQSLTVQSMTQEMTRLLNSGQVKK